jgi:hypothetical protein
MDLSRGLGDVYKRQGCNYMPGCFESASRLKANNNF